MTLSKRKTCSAQRRRSTTDIYKANIFIWMYLLFVGNFSKHLMLFPIYLLGRTIKTEKFSQAKIITQLAIIGSKFDPMLFVCILTIILLMYTYIDKYLHNEKLQFGKMHFIQYCIN